MNIHLFSFVTAEEDLLPLHEVTAVIMLIQYSAVSDTP